MRKKRILITGINGELGKFLAQKLFDEGFEIIGTDIHDNVTNELVNRVIYFSADLSDILVISSLHRKLASKFDSIDIVINNASIRYFKDFNEFTFSEISTYFNMNTVSPVMLVNLLLPSMLKINFGRIINISSVSAFHGYSTGSLYCSSKMSLITFAESLSKELNKTNSNITINTICPDSFQKQNGEKFKDYSLITNKIYKKILEIINSDGNGKVYIASNFSNTLKYKLSLLIKVIKFKG